jgi:hypothetical protein
MVPLPTHPMVMAHSGGRIVSISLILIKKPKITTCKVKNGTSIHLWKDGIREDDLPQLFSFTKSKMSSYQNESSLP